MLYDELRKEVKIKKKLHKLKMKMNRLDPITEASLRFEESIVFTSIKPKNGKYLVKLIEEAWVRRLNRAKAKALRLELLKLPYSCRGSYMELSGFKAPIHN